MRSILAALLALLSLAAASGARAQGVSLRVSLAGPDRLRTGDPLALRFTFVNRGANEVRVIAPVYGSWEGAREPAYSLELLDDAGELVPSALGWEEGLECGVLDPIAPSDVVRVPARASREVRSTSNSMPAHRVLTSARPGTYRLRVRYRSRDPHGAPLALVSNEVPITIAGGDARLWACRAAQLRAREQFRAVGSGPIALVGLDDAGTHGVLAFLRSVRGPEDASGQEHLTTQLWAVHVDAQLAPIGPPVQVFEARELGYPPAATRTSRGVLFAALHDARGADRAQLRELRIDGATQTLGPVHVMRAGGGMGLSLDASDGRAWLVQGDMLDGPLRAFPLAEDGAPRGAPIALAPARHHSGHGVVAADATGAWAVWRRLPATGGQAMAQRLDATGATVGAPIVLDVEGEPVALHDRGAELDLVHQDNGTQGSDPNDTMGLMIATLRRDGGRVSLRGLSPLDRSDPRFGHAAVSGSALGFAFVDQRRRLVFGIGRSQRELSAAATGVRVDRFGDGFAVSWGDVSDDGSTACRELRQCAVETYAAILDPAGRVRTPPRRMTHDATPPPIRAHSRDWQRFCP